MRPRRDARALALAALAALSTGFADNRDGMGALGASPIVGAVGAPAATFFASDAMGGELEARAALSGLGYELRVEREPSRTRSVLYLDGSELEETICAYEGGRLVSKEIRRGELKERFEYRYAADGRPVSIRAPDGATSLGGDDPRATASRRWSVEDGALTLRVYREDGRLASTARYEGDEPRSVETLSWKDGRLESSRLEEGDEATVTEYLLDGPAAGLLSARRRLLGDSQVSLARYGYDAEGRLAFERIEEGGAVVLREYAYDAEGKLLTDTESLNGAVVKVARREPDGARTEELYAHGAVVARVRYEDGRRVLEEILKGGTVVRTRAFE